MTGPGPRRATPAARMEKRSVARMPALSRERPKPHAPVCPGLRSSASCVTLIFRCPVSGTGRLRQLPGGKRVTVRRQAGSHAKRGRGPLCGAGKRRARSEVFRRTARGKVIFYGRSRGEPRHLHEINRRSSARGESRNRRRRRDIAACSGGATQNAAKTVMTDRIAARGGRTRIRPGSTYAAREGEGGGGRGCGEEALQQKRINRECADRSAPYHRPFPKPPHRQSLYPLRSQSHSSEKVLVGVRGSAAPPDLFSTLLRKSLITAPERACKPTGRKGIGQLGNERRQPVAGPKRVSQTAPEGAMGTPRCQSPHVSMDQPKHPLGFSARTRTHAESPDFSPGTFFA